MLEISFKNVIEKHEGPIVTAVFEEAVLSESAKAYDQITQGVLSRALKNNRFKGKFEEIIKISCPSGMDASDLYIIGLGKASELTPSKFEELGAKIISSIPKNLHATVVVDINDKQLSNNNEANAQIASGVLLRSWQFNKYKTKKKDEPVLKNIVFITPHVEASKQAFLPLQAVAEGVFLARHVVTEPPNVIYPESMAEIAKDELKSLGVKVEILDEKDMKKLGMGALLGVGQGSIRESRLIVLSWMNGPKDQKTVAIVGKGVTFDTGGISIKPSNGMEDMKYDMGGSAVVLGLMKALALRKAKVNVVGVMGMVENMPSGSAQRPADVVTSMSGQTIEVVNTDAEGRLVLADALWYTQDRFKPQIMIDLATLTGAITVALGHEYAGLFSNNDQLADALFESGQSTHEPVWRFPMGKNYDRDIDSDIADVKNVGSGRGAGSTTAAQFLQRFVNDVPWAHLDIAGMAWDKKPKPLSGKGATGYGVRLLNEYVQKNFEN